MRLTEVAKVQGNPRPQARGWRVVAITAFGSESYRDSHIKTQYCS